MAPSTVAVELLSPKEKNRVSARPAPRPRAPAPRPGPAPRPRAPAPRPGPAPRPRAPAPRGALTPPPPQLRKPVVEKMRRDRINSSIEQLKLLLEQEFARHQPNSKLEKADILEMAVSYLKHSKGERRPARPPPARAPARRPPARSRPPPAAFAAAAGPKSLHQDYSEGYSWCLQEAVQFLTLHAAGDTQRKLLYHFQRPPAAPPAPKEAKAPAAAPPPPPAPKTSAAARQPAGGLWRPW
ncbi:Transcription factor HES-5 [Galemys pyrenaicus]|uniref:Transcription factor HES-5 n=1 Tax=Galemys pyrenaicus TaxID=202257 RepID=A0A8J6DF73_GALPY|nr:Transcription factor HES-5 [Galemys pyrenaicus]